MRRMLTRTHATGAAFDDEVALQAAGGPLYRGVKRALLRAIECPARR
jgi:hypothetical protein